MDHVTYHVMSLSNYDSNIISYVILSTWEVKFKRVTSGALKIGQNLNFEF